VIQLDLRGKVCPYPTIEVYRALQVLAPGEHIEVLSDFAPARSTVPSLATDFDCVCEVHDGEGGVFTIFIEKLVATSARGA
jgi:TusA-related sulfurtransferase